jgi:hypothetical protein
MIMSGKEIGIKFLIGLFLVWVGYSSMDLTDNTLQHLAQAFAIVVGLVTVFTCAKEFK